MNNGGMQQQQGTAAPSTSLVDEVLEHSEKSFSMLKEQAGIALRSRYLAEAIATDDQATTIVMIGRELGIPPMTALREIHLIESNGKFKPAISSHLKHALAMKKVPGFMLEVLQADARACIVTAWRPGMKQPARFSWTVEDSQRAGLTQPSRNGKPSNHVKYPIQMFAARAKAIAIDTIAPEATIGFPTVEEVRDEAYLERLADMPAVGAMSGKDPADARASAPPPDPSAPRMKSFHELEALLSDCRSVGELEGFRDAFKPDRLALAKEEREALVADWTRRYAEAGGKAGRAANAKAATAQAAAPSSPAPSSDVAPAPAPPATPAAASPSPEGDEDDAKPARAPRRSPEEVQASQAAAEKELLEDLDACPTKDDLLAWEETDGFKARWVQLSPAGKGRMRAKIKEREKALEGGETAAAPTKGEG